MTIVCTGKLIFGILVSLSGFFANATGLKVQPFADQLKFAYWASGCVTDSHQ
jgi:hypothetical protein